MSAQIAILATNNITNRVREDRAEEEDSSYKTDIDIDIDIDTDDDFVQLARPFARISKARFRPQG